jgi:multidrug efflux pump subunit AcrB
MDSGKLRIPLKELVTWKIEEGEQEIRRENHQNEVLVTAVLEKGTLNKMVSKIRKIMKELHIPRGCRLVFSGEKEEMTRSFRSLITAFVISILLVYMISCASVVDHADAPLRLDRSRLGIVFHGTVTECCLSDWDGGSCRDSGQ